MPKINQIIPPQSFEIVRDQIATILKNELVNQANLDPNFEEPEVYINRFVNLDTAYLPAVNVTTDRGAYQNQSIRHQWGEYSWQIEFYHHGKATDTEEGSEVSGRKLEELMGRARAILMNHQYYHLDLQTPTPGRRYFNDFTVGNPTQSNSKSVSLAMMNFIVEVSETELLETPEVINSHHTIVLVGDPETGFKWVYNQ